MSPCRILAGTFLAVAAAATAHAQVFHKGGADFNAHRLLVAPSGRAYTILQTEFYHQGEIQAGGKNVLVLGARQQPAPFRVLQLGPGDFCRLAIQLQPGVPQYEIYYGGGEPTDPIPQWTCKDGLLLETREYTRCDLNSFEAVKAAFERAKPIGATYVEAVHHSFNPCTPVLAPFMSRYSATLHLSSGGTYGFMTSSRDCSFLVVDGKLAVGAPGHHPPLSQAKPGSRGDVKLGAGPHAFEYYHAASGPEAMMVAAWEINPAAPKPEHVQAISSDHFRADAVAYAHPEAPALKNVRTAPDFFVRLEGSVPLPDNDVPLVGVSFRNWSSKSITLKAKAIWDFGDGQTSEEPEPLHVYLHPGLYTVKLTVAQLGKSLECVNRVLIEAPVLTRDMKEHDLDMYLPMLRDTYDASKLDALSVRQLVEAFEAKAAKIEAGEEDPPRHRKPDPNDYGGDHITLEELKERASRVAKWVYASVEVGKRVFLTDSAAKGDEDLLKLIKIIGPMARDRQGDAATAFALWNAAAQKIQTPESKAYCQVQAALIAITDLLKPALARPLLEAAAKPYAQARQGEAINAFHRAWGDYYAATGNGKSARKEYQDAEAANVENKEFARDTAWRGAHNRSTEDFLKDGLLDRAAGEIREWERQFPTEKISGQLTLMYGNYFYEREQYAQVIGLSEQLMNVSADSPDIDQLLLLAAKSARLLGKSDQARAILNQLLKDYPGSPEPLLREARQQLAALKNGETLKKKPSRKVSNR